MWGFISENLHSCLSLFLLISIFFNLSDVFLKKFCNMWELNFWNQYWMNKLCFMYQCVCGNHRLKYIIKVTKSEEFWALRLSVAQKFSLSIYTMIVWIFSMSFFFFFHKLCLAQKRQWVCSRTESWLYTFPLFFFCH